MHEFRFWPIATCGRKSTVGDRGKADTCYRWPAGSNRGIASVQAIPIWYAAITANLLQIAPAREPSDPHARVALPIPVQWVGFSGEVRGVKRLGALSA